MIFPALLTVCEDAIHREWIGSAVYHPKIRDAPINTQDVQTFTIASFCSALRVTSRLPRLCLHSLAFASLGFVNKINGHTYMCFLTLIIILGVYCVSHMHLKKKGIIRYVAQESTYTNQQSSRLWHDVDLMNMMWYHYLSPSLRQYVDQKGHCSKAINLTPLRRANNSPKWG